jgi:predicted Rossmann fold nucleotide-binding protein DprA/Smf involved in DNA uptake
MSSQEDTHNRAALLKRLRKEHEETVARTQELLREQKAIRREICRAMGDHPRTVLEVAQATGLPSPKVLWHLTAMKTYGLVAEVGMCGEYYQYQLAKETSE